MLKFLLIFAYNLLYLCNINLCEHLQKQPISRGNELQNLAGRSATLLVSTIDGYLNAIDAQTGIDKWRFKEGPVLESPVNVQRGFTFIPDPRDGQLYFLSEGRLNKLPFTIPYLVRVSPCKSSDGVFYAGHKKDVWISLNPETGERMDPFAATSPGSCPANHAQAVHIGKTEYQIQMMDTKFKDRHWNATFIDYSSHLLPEEVDYALQHFTSTNDGRVMTVDSNSGFVLWQRDFGNVIVNMYLLKGDGMHRLPSTAIGRETFDLLAQSATLNPLLYAPAQLPNRLFSTLYVGECPRVGLYALPAFVDERTNRIGPKYLGPPLLEGPNPQEKSETEQKEDDFSFENNRERQLLPPDTIGQTYTTKDGEFLILGYHQLPKGIPNNELFPMALPSSSNVAQITFNQKEKGIKQMPNTARSNDEQILASDSAYIISEGGFLIEMFNFAQRYPYQFSAFLVVIIALCIVFAYLASKQRGLMRHRTWSSGSTLTAISETGDASRSSRGSVYTAYEPVDLPAGWHRVNNSNLSYNSAEILGRGCEGTFVYLGKFDDRKVAVKRIVSANLERGVRQQIEREVMHLRQSDTHPNVIRYFCSETDQHFHYIALEFCNGNLEQLIGLKILLREDKLDLLKQTTDGIAHLHRINIVHRDVKPKNILIIRSESMKDKNIAGQIRVKISDFGLCKSIKLGHNSISKVSGVVGTEGWMAPELFSLDSSVTYAVDVFSLGCVFYYVLTDGQHPFGEPLSRMNNIKFGIFSLDSLDEHQEYTSRDFIETMIRSDNKNRPMASAVAAHPLFWDQSKQLQFLMEVSDWIEKKDIKDPIMRRLEWRREKVVGNWLEKIDELLKQDLMKQRHYMNNLRDLLRAIRNKKHHYQELSPELQALLGSMPNDYLAYFTTRFPRLLMHTFMAMTIMGKESVFKDYYQSEKLREFYERERSSIIRAEPERRSASPANWRTPRPKSQPVVPLTALAIVNQQNIVHAPAFDPSIPPPEIPFVVPIPASIKVVDSPQSDDPIDGKQKEEGFSVPNNPVKNGKPKKTRRKKRKAPFALLMSGNDDEEEEANIQGEEEIEMGEENIKNINDKRIN